LPKKAWTTILSSLLEHTVLRRQFCLADFFAA
jgi:hypothetical protein